MERARSHSFQPYNKKKLNKLNKLKIYNFSWTHQKAEVARVANTLKSGEFREKPKQGFKRGHKTRTAGKPEACGPYSCSKHEKQPNLFPDSQESSRTKGLFTSVPIT